MFKTKNKMNEQNVKRLNLTLDKEFYELLKQRADQDFIPIGTYVKQYLMKALLPNNTYSKCLTQNGKVM